MIWLFTAPDEAMQAALQAAGETVHVRSWRTYGTRMMDKIQYPFVEEMRDVGADVLYIPDLWTKSYRCYEKVDLHTAKSNLKCIIGQQYDPPEDQPKPKGCQAGYGQCHGLVLRRDPAAQALAKNMAQRYIRCAIWDHSDPIQPVIDMARAIVDRVRLGRDTPPWGI